MMNAKLEIPALKDNLSQATAFVGERLEKIGCGLKLQMQIETAVEEIFINIVAYAYPDSTGNAVIEVSCEDDILNITFADSGTPFDPLAHTDPDTTLPAEERQIGGLGILMVKKMMDEVTYRRENGCNILNIQKSIK